MSVLPRGIFAGILLIPKHCLVFLRRWPAGAWGLGGIFGVEMDARAVPHTLRFESSRYAGDKLHGICKL